MYPKFNLPLFIFLSISMHPLGFFCQEILDSLNCVKSFQCANQPNLTFPFWDIATIPPGNLSLCGHPSLGLHCSSNAPILNISQVPYRIIDFNFSSNIMKVSRLDLYGADPCKPFPPNTTLSSTLFQVWPKFRYQNVTLYYNCIEKVPGLPNKFNCGVLKTKNFFQIGDHYPTKFTCRQQITFPMSEPEVSEMKTETDLFAAAQRGNLGSFAINWLAYAMECNECNRSGHTCAYSCLPSRNGTVNSRDFYSYIGPSKEQEIMPRGEPPQQRSPPVSTITGSPGSNRQHMIKLGLLIGGMAFILALALFCWRYKLRHLVASW